MSWLEKQISLGREINPATIKFPFEHELVPGFLSTEIHWNEFLHKDTHISCWTFLSKGFATTGQKEIAITIQAEPEQTKLDFPEAVIEFFKTAFQHALSGIFVDYGSISEFGKSGFIDTRFKALGYIPCQNFGDWSPPDNYMAGIILTETEYEAAKLFGLTRVAALIGKAILHFPCPAWNETKRESVISTQRLEAMKNSPISQIPRMFARSAIVTKTDDLIELKLPAHAKAYFENFEAADDSTPICLLTDIDPEADALLIWHDKANGSAPMAITAPGTAGKRVTGSFICFAPSQTDDSGLIVEDGFAVSLKPSSWLSLKRSFLQGSNFHLTHSTGGCDFKLIWTDYVSPVSRSRPLPPTAESCAHEDETETNLVPAYATKVQILTDAQTVEALISNKELNAFIEHIEDLVRDHFFCSGQEDGMELVLSCAIHPEKQAAFDIINKGTLDAEDESYLLDRLSLTYAPDISSGKIAFEIYFAVWGGTQKPD